VADKLLHVECYAGYQADQRPTRVLLNDQWVEVRSVEDRWYSPGSTLFRVLVATGERYVLRHDDAQDLWTLEAFRAAEKNDVRP
jgi:hypothetical protein